MERRRIAAVNEPSKLRRHTKHACRRRDVAAVRETLLDHMIDETEQGCETRPLRYRRPDAAREKSLPAFLS